MNGVQGAIRRIYRHPKPLVTDNEWKAVRDGFGPPDLVIQSPKFTMPAEHQDVWFRPMSDIPSLDVIMFISSYEFVAHSVHGQKETGLLRNRFEFLANPYNMSIHSPGRWKVLVTPDLVEQAFAAQGLPRMT